MLKDKTKLLVVAVIAFSVTACSILPNFNDIKQAMPWYRANQVDKIAVYVVPDATLQYAINIDVLFIYNTLAHTVISGLTAEQWFQQKNGLKASYGQHIKTLEWQMVSGYGDDSKPLPSNHKRAIAVIAFALSPKNPNAKIEITEFSTPWLVFDKQQLTVKLTPPNSAAQGKGK